MRSTLSRSDKFDSNLYPILPVEEVKTQIKSSALWLNIQVLQLDKLYSFVCSGPFFDLSVLLFFITD